MKIIDNIMYITEDDYTLHSHSNIRLDYDRYVGDYIGDSNHDDNIIKLIERANKNDTFPDITQIVFLALHMVRYDKVMKITKNMFPSLTKVSICSCKNISLDLHTDVTNVYVELSNVNSLNLNSAKSKISLISSGLEHISTRDLDVITYTNSSIRYIMCDGVFNIDIQGGVFTSYLLDYVDVTPNIASIRDLIVTYAPIAFGKSSPFIRDSKCNYYDFDLNPIIVDHNRTSSHDPNDVKKLITDINLDV